MRTGIRFGIDVGKARIGVARSDMHGMLASPVATLDRASDWQQKLVSLIADGAPLEIYVGYPLNLKGEHTASTDDAVSVAREIADMTDVSVRLVDERLTTNAAHQQLHSSGKKQHQTRSVVDQVAAVMLVQHALDYESNTGKVPGTPIADMEE